MGFSRCLQKCLHKSFIIHLYPSRPLGVQPLERLCELPDHDAAPHESIEGDAGHFTRSTDRTVFALDELDEIWIEVVPELAQGVPELSSVYRAAPICVEVSKDPLPIFDVLPQPGEFVEGDSTAPIGVEHRHQELDRIQVEGGPVTIYEGCLKFMGRYGPAPICVHC